MVTVGQLMKQDLVTVDTGTSVIEAAKLMTACSVGSVLVAKKGHIVGIVTETDVVRKFVGADRLYSRGRDHEQSCARDRNREAYHRSRRYDEQVSHSPSRCHKRRCADRRRLRSRLSTACVSRRVLDPASSPLRHPFGCSGNGAAQPLLAKGFPEWNIHACCNRDRCLRADSSYPETLNL